MDDGIGIGISVVCCAEQVALSTCIDHSLHPDHHLGFLPYSTQLREKELFLNLGVVENLSLSFYLLALMHIYRLADRLLSEMIHAFETALRWIFEVSIQRPAST